MVEASKNIIILSTYIKTLEDEIREMRQRLERIERTIKIDEYRGAPISINSHLNKIIETSSEVLNKIEKANIPIEKDPIKLLTIPEIPVKLAEIKKMLNQLDDN